MIYATPPTQKYSVVEHKIVYILKKKRRKKEKKKRKKEKKKNVRTGSRRVGHRRHISKHQRQQRERAVRRRV
jgi:hypothetical protein